MPVEDLGLNVFVEGFQKFEKQMDMMDKSVDELVKDWRSMAAPAKDAAKSIDKVGQEAEKTTKETKKLSASQKILSGAYDHVGRLAVDFARQLPRMAVELVKLGAAAQRQSAALDNLAVAAGTSGQDITQAIQSSSNFTIDRMTAMSAASKAMMLDVAKTPEQFERLTKVAVRLGQAMSMDAAKSIDDFVTAAGRQSIMIADNLGLTVKAGEANKKYADEMGKTVKQLTAAEKKQAFLNAMLDAGEKKTAEMGKSTGDTASKIEKLTAAAADAKLELAIMAAEAVDAAVNVDNLAESIRTMPGRLEETTSQIGFLIQATLKGVETTDIYREAMEHQHNILIETSRSYEKYTAAVRETGVATLEGQEAAEGLGQAMTEAEWINKKVTESERILREERKNQADIMEFNLDIARAAARASDELDTGMARLNERAIVSQGVFEGVARAHDRVHEAAEEERLTILTLALATEEHALQSTMSWKKYFDETEGAQEEFIFNLAAAEETHQAKMLELLAEGDTAKIAEEEAYYARKIESMRAMHAEEEEEQRASLGRMLLQQFEAWSALKEIPAEKAMEMRTAIALEYGLMDAESARVVGEMTGSWETWADGFDQSATDVMGDMDAVIGHAAALQAAIDRIPRKVPIEIAISRAGIPGIEMPEMMQHGTPRFRGGLAMLGERGPELAVLPPATQVYNSTTTRNMVSNYNLTTQSMVQPGGLRMEFETMRMASR